MANTLRIKRRWTGTAAAPVALKSGEPAFNGVNGVLYLGYGDDGAGNATSVVAIGGDGSFVTTSSAQTVDGVKTFGASPLVPTASVGDSSTKAASTAFVAASVAAVSIPDGDKGDLIVSGGGGTWTIDNGVVTNAKQAAMPTATLKGNASAGTAAPADLTMAQVKVLLALTRADVGLANVDNTSDAAKPISNATQAALNAKAALASPALTGTPTAPTAASGTATTQIASTAFVAAEIAARIAAADAMVYKGAIDASANPNYPAASAGDTWRFSVGGRIGGAAGVKVEAGDMIICHLDGSAAGTQAVVGANWDVIQTNIDGALTTTSIGVTVQGYDATLQSVSGKTLTAAAFALLDDVDTAAQRGTLGLGSLATQNANAVAITGGSIDGITLDGGTY